MTKKAPKKYLTVKEVAARYTVTVATVWRWARKKEGFPEPVKIGIGTTRWRVADLEAFELTLKGVYDE